LVDDFKARAAKAETELADYRKNLLPENDRKGYEERLTKAESRNKELEDEIRYVNYSKSAEFRDKYQQPYENAWKRAMSELSEIAVTDAATGQQRATTPQDLMNLVNMPLGQARGIAEQIFGPFASDVIAYRKEIRGLWDAQSAALEDAKKNGGLREQQQREAMERQTKELGTNIKSTWDEVNSRALEDPNNGQYFKSREGVADWNQRLQKGFELVDRAYSENPTNPNLSPEERKNVIARHAAVRNRAAGWGALKWENQQLKSQLEEALKELKGYKASNPDAGGTVPSSEANGNHSAWGDVSAALRKLAK
jgi:hypothetical protein